MELVVYLFHLHRNPELFPEPTKFNPDRFLRSGKKSENAYTYIPFSAGARNCIGQRFAKMEQKVALATILRQYDVKSDTTFQDLDDNLGSIFTLRSFAGLKMRFKRRENV